ncbi:MAG: metal-dependent hydrolase [Halobacteriota archaeon]
MMATTHALVGVALALGASLFLPGVGPLAVAAAALGGLFPDFDLYAGHRRTLHFPVYFTVATLPALALAAASPGPFTTAIALFLAAAAVHSVMDIAGGGLELRPWLGTSQRAVYDHYNQRWIPPKRWVRYDGSPEDLLLAVVVAVPSVYTFEGLVQLAIVGALVVSAAYVLLRKPMVTVAEAIVDALPAHVVGWLPERFVRDFQ